MFGNTSRCVSIILLRLIEFVVQVILFSEGFREGKALGRKLVAIFNMSREMLTPQQHYDWGLRALKTVLKGSGQGLQALRRQSENESEASNVGLVNKFISSEIIQAGRGRLLPSWSV